MLQWHSFYRYFSLLFTTGPFTTSCQNPSLSKFLQDVEKGEDKIEIFKLKALLMHLLHVSAIIYRKENKVKIHKILNCFIALYPA